MDVEAKMSVLNPTVYFANPCIPQSFQEKAFSSEACCVSDFTIKSIGCVLEQRESLPTFFDLMEIYNNQNALLSHSLVTQSEQNIAQFASSRVDSISRRRLVLRPAKVLNYSMEPALVHISAPTYQKVIKKPKSHSPNTDFDHDYNRFAFHPPTPILHPQIMGINLIRSLSNTIVNIIKVLRLPRRPL